MFTWLIYLCLTHCWLPNYAMYWTFQLLFDVQFLVIFKTVVEFVHLRNSHEFPRRARISVHVIDCHDLPSATGCILFKQSKNGLPLALNHWHLWSFCSGWPRSFFKQRSSCLRLAVNHSILLIAASCNLIQTKHHTEFCTIAQHVVFQMLIMRNVYLTRFCYGRLERSRSHFKSRRLKKHLQYVYTSSTCASPTIAQQFEYNSFTSLAILTTNTHTLVFFWCFTAGVIM